jgi:preprotein translocase subunit YajC
MFLISDAMAADAGAAGGIMQFLPLIVVFVVFYFLLIRPQQKRTKEHKAMLEALQKGDEVVTAGGILGKVKEIDENFVSIDVGGGTMLSVQRPHIAQLMPKGTFKKK